MVGTSPTMTERPVFMGSGLAAARRPGMTAWLLASEIEAFAAGLADALDQ
jgi:hypothetical protein